MDTKRQEDVSGYLGINAGGLRGEIGQGLTETPSSSWMDGGATQPQRTLGTAPVPEPLTKAWGAQCSSPTVLMPRPLHVLSLTQLLTTFSLLLFLTAFPHPFLIIRAMWVGRALCYLNYLTIHYWSFHCYKVA